MTIDTLPAQIFHTAIVQMGHHDRFARKAIGTNFIPVACDKDGYRLRDEDDDEHEVFMSHQQIYNELAKGISEVVCGWNCPEMTRLRVHFRETPLKNFPIERQNLAKYREMLFNLWDDHVAELGKPARLCTAALQAWINEQDGNPRKEATSSAGSPDFRLGELLRNRASIAKRRTASLGLIDDGHLVAVSSDGIDKLA